VKYIVKVEFVVIDKQEEKKLTEMEYKLHNNKLEADPGL
jgi:hypothetical protein